MDGVKSWLSKSKGSSKAVSDDGSLKSSSPAGSRKAFACDRWDEEQDTLESARRSKHFSRSYQSDSDTESRAAETSA